MLPSLLAMTCAAFASAPGEPQAASAAAVDLGISVGPTHFFAKNFASEPRVLVFRRDGSPSWHVLAPLGELACSFPRQALEGVSVEMLAHDGDHWSASGSFALDELSGGDTLELWIQGGAHPTGWTQAAGGIVHRPAHTNLVPTWLLGTTPTFVPASAAAPAAPAHVPVITPSKHPKGDVPPQIGSKPLPSV